MTFDELYERASTSLALTADAESQAAEDTNDEISDDSADLPF